MIARREGGAEVGKNLSWFGKGLNCLTVNIRVKKVVHLAYRLSFVKE